MNKYKTTLKGENMKKYLVSLSLVLSALTASADWVATPSVGYSTGSSALQYTYSGQNKSYDLSGVPLQLSTGYKSSGGWYTGVEGSYTVSGSLSSSSVTDSFTATTAGVELGYLGTRWNLLAGYDFTNSLTISTVTGSTNPNSFGGTGSFAKLGYRFSPTVGLNVQYYLSNLTSVNGGDVSSSSYSSVSESHVSANLTFTFGAGK